MCLFKQGLRDSRLKARQADIETGLQDVPAVCHTEIDLGIDGGPLRQLDLAPVGRDADRAEEAG